MKPIKMTLFITAAILFSIMLGTLKAHAAAPYGQCSSGSKNLYMDIQIYNQTEKFSADNGFVGEKLESELKKLRMNQLSLKEKVHSLETSFVNCDIGLSEDDELAIEVDVDMFKKGNSPSASQE